MSLISPAKKICPTGVFLANADSSLLIATSATIASEFQELTRASWLLTSYALATCAAQPLVRRLVLGFDATYYLICLLILMEIEVWKIE